MIWLIVILCTITIAFIDGIPKARRVLLIILCAWFTVIVAIRTDDWNDTQSYWLVFHKLIHPVWSLSDIVTKNHYIDDKGFLLISSVIKTFTSDRFWFFGCIAAVTNFFLYKDLQKYSIYPLAGFFIYIGRFALSRNFMQIRAALAILIVIYAIKFIQNNDWKRYFLWMAIASSMHLSMVFAIPLYWINKIPLNAKRIISITIVALIITYFMAPLINSFATKISLSYDIATAYTKSTSEYAEGKGLANPMIYYQILILWVYSLLGNKLSKSTPYYQVIRNGYLYSTLILIILSSFGVLCARISTIFATLEIFILPNLCAIVPQRFRYFARLTICGVGLLLFYIYFGQFLINHPSFHNPLSI
ncbi:MAG: EpsG family protein [Muribaculaceae bacterium]|nr:EpsG family protein [Muribaculaceae bacterium]